MISAICHTVNAFRFYMKAKQKKLTNFKYMLTVLSLGDRSYMCLGSRLY